MERNEKRLEVIKFLSDFFKKDISNFSDKTIAGDIEGWDSLAHVELLLRVEQKFSISFDLHELISLNNVGDLVAIIEKKCL
jgi:acyl carrier protein